MTLRLHLLLSASNFIQGLAAFSVLGLLSVIGADLDVPTHEAGHLMSLYALVYALSSPVLVAVFGLRERKSLLLAGLALLGLGAALAAVAPSWSVTLLARAIMAVGGGLITPVAASVAIVTSTPQARGRALALVFAGLPLAQAVGVPLGTWMADVLSWRATFGVIAAGAAIMLVATARLVPAGVRVQPVSLGSLGASLRDGRTLLAVSFIVFFIGSNFTLLTYLAPFLGERYGLASVQLAVVLAIYGCGAFLGNVVGGALNDRVGPARTLMLLCGVTAFVLPALTVLPLPLAWLVLLLVVWAVFGWSVHAPQQARLAQLDPSRAPVLLALHSSALYAGSSLGSALGAHVLQHGGSQWLGPAGAGLIVFAAASLLVVDGLQLKKA